MMSHLNPKIYKPPVQERTGFPNQAILNSGGDREVLLDLAGNIKRHIERQINDPQAQNTAFALSPPCKAPNKWTYAEVHTLRVFFHPLAEVDRVLPAECEPTAEELQPHAQLLDAQWNEAFFRDPTRWTTVARKSSLRLLLIHINQLLHLDELGEEDKHESYVDTVFRSLVEFLDVGNIDITPIVLEENLDLITRFANTYEYHTKVQFALTLRRYYNSGKVFVFIEDKRLKGVSPGSRFAHKVAEALAFADTNFERGNQENDQEIFGVGVRHHYFTFWHAVFPSKYLARLRNNPTLWEASDYAIIKCYPESNFGLDICNPAERTTIVKCLLKIFKYVATEMNN